MREKRISDPKAGQQIILAEPKTADLRGKKWIEPRRPVAKTRRSHILFIGVPEGKEKV